MFSRKTGHSPPPAAPERRGPLHPIVLLFVRNSVVARRRARDGPALNRVCSHPPFRWAHSPKVCWSCVFDFASSGLDFRERVNGPPSSSASRAPRRCSPTVSVYSSPQGRAPPAVRGHPGGCQARSWSSWWTAASNRVCLLERPSSIVCRQHTAVLWPLPRPLLAQNSAPSKSVLYPSLHRVI